MWPCLVSSDSDIGKFPALIALVQVSSTGWPADAWRYLVVSFGDGKLKTLFASSCFGLSPSVSTVHKFDPVGLLPLCTGGSLVVMVSVPDLWMVTPLFPL